MIVPAGEAMVEPNYPARRRELGWYRPLVRNTTVLGSLFTLVHLPFMLAFASMVVIGAIAIAAPDLPVLILSVLAVCLTLYGEHLLDDTVPVGKPWDTVFSDRALTSAAAMMFVIAIVIAVLAGLYLSSPLPLIGVILGVAFSILYGLEVWKFHTVAFGAVGMGAAAPFSYAVQAIAREQPIAPPVLVLLLIFGSTYAYVLLALYEHTKTGDHAFAWRLLGLQFVTIYALAGVSLLVSFA